MFALEVKNLSKTFGTLKAVDDVSFNVPEGSVFGLIGRNGAGKTTTIRMMMNIYMPDSGEVVLRGTKVDQDFKNKVGYLPEERGLYKKMKVMDILLYFAELKGKSGKVIQNRALNYLKHFQLLDRKDSKIEDLSKGNQQKVQFIATVLHDPEFIILDEPFSGLDPVNTNILKDIIMQLKSEGKIIILSTHLMDFAEKLCDHIAMIDKGKMILHGSLKDIKNEFAKKNISIECEENLEFVKQYDYVEALEQIGSLKSIRLKSADMSQQFLKDILAKNIYINKFTANDISLHEIFVKLANNEDEREVANV